MDLLTLAILCGPWVAPATTLSVIQVESGGQVYAVHDNTGKRSFTPATLQEAEALAGTLIHARHRVDLGLMQISYEAWLKPAQVRLDQAFDACTNIALGTTLLSAAFARESLTSRTQPEALMRALSVYNSGDPNRARDYAALVLRASRSTGPRPVRVAARVRAGD